MLGRPAQSHVGGAALVVVLAATLIAALPGAAVPARAGTVVAAVPDPRVSPGTLQFERIEPGTTEVRTATVTPDAPDGAAVVRAVVSGTGELAAYLTTRVEVCAVAWTAQGCSAGEVVLVAGSVGAGMDATLDVPVPESGVAYLRVGITADSAAPANAASRVSYELHLLAPDAPPPTPAPSPSAPPVAGGGGPPAPAGPGYLPTTGAEIAALGAAALALVALGLTLRTWGRERRRAGSTGWTS
ncbi:hypothetical protein [Cellulomonas sp. P5_C5]